MLGNYLFFRFRNRELEGFQTPPSAEMALKHKKKLPAGITLFPPVPADCAPRIPARGWRGLGGGAQLLLPGGDSLSFAQLGSALAQELRPVEHIKRPVLLLLQHHVGRMAVSRNLQMRKIIASPYAWGVLSVPKEVV